MSRWTSVLVQAVDATAGIVDSFIKASHITRTRRAHQIAACALYQALQVAHQEHKPAHLRLICSNKQLLPIHPITNKSQSLVLKLDPYNYARWVSVHLRNMVSFSHMHAEFVRGQTTVQNHANITQIVYRSCPWTK